MNGERLRVALTLVDDEFRIDLPNELVQRLQLHEGQEFDLDFRADGGISLTRCPSPADEFQTIESRTP